MRRMLRAKRDITGNFPGLPAVFPDGLAPVDHTAPDGERELSMMRWGFPPRPNLGKVPVTNVRNVGSPYWRGWLKAEWRCLVPATSFCEWTDTRPKLPHWLAPPERRPFFAFAGIWRLWTGERKGQTGEHQLFAFLTTGSNEVVKPIHAKGFGTFVGYTCQ
jgi:putative SOS response-associated peptidase YedK